MQSSYFRICLWLLVALYTAASFYGCKSDEESEINGFWKAVNIQLPGGTSVAVDSQFYAFQRKYVFSFTRLIDQANAPASFGYVDYPEKNKIHILMDLNHTEASFPLKSQWHAFEATFTINTISGNRLVLQKGDTLFILKKY